MAEVFAEGHAFRRTMGADDSVQAQADQNNADIKTAAGAVALAVVATAVASGGLVGVAAVALAAPKFIWIAIGSYAVAMGAFSFVAAEADRKRNRVLSGNASVNSL